MEWYKKMKIWSVLEKSKREAIFDMLQKKTQTLSLQAYLINHCQDYQSITLPVLEKMFALDASSIRREVNALLLQGLVDASWNEDATVLVFVETLSSGVETVATQLMEKVKELEEANENVKEELKNERREEQMKFKNRKPGSSFAQRNLRTRTRILKG